MDSEKSPEKQKEFIDTDACSNSDRSPEITPSQPSHHQKSESGFQSISLDDPSMVKLEKQYNAKYTTIIWYARFLQVYSIIDCLLCFIYFLSEFYYLIILIIMPVNGYLAGYHLNRTFLSIYILYQLGASILRLVIIGIVEDVAFTILTTLVIISTGFVLLFLIRFFRFLGRVNRIEKQEIYLLMHGNNKVQMEILQKRKLEMIS
ncbi:unnamed protein product [Blepharisma stoltei]|uniref:PRA1 family protein n=1 Tax=Blepharisma stoltei TaxID=1481888 RepID=A0AAU9IZN8_9CILI|nr:unnamed protein product [Blepharisma stoltei]